MSVKFNVKTKIKIGGKEYSSPEEMPPDVRQIYEQALAKGVIATHVNTNSKINFNGQSYNSVDEMPADTRRLYESVMSAVDKDGDGIPDSIRAAGKISASTPLLVPPSAQRSVIQPENSNRAMLIAGIGLGLLIFLALAVFLLPQMMK